MLFSKASGNLGIMLLLTVPALPPIAAGTVQKYPL